MSDDEDRRPEEQWANEMALENCDPEDEDNIKVQNEVQNKLKARIPEDSYAAQNPIHSSGVETNIEPQNEGNVDLIEEVGHPIVEEHNHYPQYSDFMPNNQIKRQEGADDREGAQPIDMPQEVGQNRVIEDGNGGNAQDNLIEEMGRQGMAQLEQIGQLFAQRQEEEEEEDNGLVLYDNRNMKELLRGQQKEYNQRVEEKLRNRKTVETVENPITGFVKRGLVGHNESKELANIKRLLKNQRIEPIESKSKPKPYYGRANIGRLNYDELIHLFKRFTFQGQYVLSTVCPEWHQIIKSEFFSRQKYLWFTNEEKSGQRFLPIEICCETCRHEMDSEPLIRVTESLFLLEVIDKMLAHTDNLKCLRLYRFEFNQLLIVKRLHRNCRQLKHLDLTECYGLTLDVIEELANSYPLMAHLILCSTDLDEKMLKSLLKGMKKLETLNVSATLINGQSFNETNILAKLKRLDIRCCPNITIHSILDFCGAFNRQLEHLKMDSYDSEEVYRQIFGNYNSLILLEVNEYETKVLAAGRLLNELTQLSRLQSLRIGKNMALNSTLFLAILQNCKEMLSFSYEFNDYGENSITEENLMEIGVQWPRLQRLELINNRKIGTQFIQSLFAFKSLHYLNLTLSPCLMDEDFAKGLKHLPYLSCLILDKCQNLGKSTLEAVIIRAHRMTNQELVVSMNYCNFTNLPYLKSKLLPTNLRITYSSIRGKRYHTFDGKRIKCGQTAQIHQFLNGN